MGLGSRVLVTVACHRSPAAHCSTVWHASSHVPFKSLMGGLD